MNSEEKKENDLVIIGSGPAGYSASIYCSRYKIDHIVVGSLFGGTITSAHKVCNYPGYDEISGTDLMMKMREQALRYGSNEKMGNVISVKKENELFVIELENREILSAKALLIATGTKRRKLGIPSEEKFEGKGISYCSTCDGMFYKDKVVGVIGGANAANMSATYLADIAKKVYIIYRKGELRGDRLWIDEVMDKQNVELILNANVVEFLGDETLNAVRIDRENRVVDLDGVFLEIGSDPCLGFDAGVKLTDEGYVVVDSEQKTSVDGIFAAGDITDASNGFQQVVTACSEGAIASNSIYYWLKSL
jgi:thioredoxin reductase (NADPH)